MRGEPSRAGAIRQSNPSKKGTTEGLYQPFIEGQCVHAKMPAGRLALCGYSPLSFSFTLTLCVRSENKIK